MPYESQTKILRLEHKKGFLKMYNMRIKEFVLYFFIEGVHLTAEIDQNRFFFAYFSQFCSQKVR